MILDRNISDASYVLISIIHDERIMILDWRIIHAKVLIATCKLSDIWYQTERNWMLEVLSNHIDERIMILELNIIHVKSTAQHTNERIMDLTLNIIHARVLSNIQTNGFHDS